MGKSPRHQKGRWPPRLRRWAHQPGGEQGLQAVPARWAEGWRGLAGWSGGPQASKRRALKGEQAVPFPAALMAQLREGLSEAGHVP
jgi:hypothetical protein